MNLRPFFGYFGSKWSASRTYPSPRYDLVVEPFAGSAGYACRWPHRQVLLIDADPLIAALWRYLIVVTAEEVLALPDLAPGEDVSTLGIPQEAQWLIGMWLHKGPTEPRTTVSSWMQKHPKGGFWGPRIRERIAQQVQHIRHWRVTEGSYGDAPDVPATWFVDPPYQKQGNAYTYNVVDYEALGVWCRQRRGQTIVCESEGADWLPFEPHTLIKSIGGKHKSAEVAWFQTQTAADPRLKRGTAAWLEAIAPQLRVQLEAVEGDCRQVVDEIPYLQECAELGGTEWVALCRDRLGTTPEFLEKISEGVSILRARGETGPIPTSRAARAQEMAKSEPASAKHGGKRDGAGRPEGTPNGVSKECAVTSNNQGDNSTLIVSRSSRGSTSALEIVRRLKRDAPDVAARLAAGEFRSARAAGIAAGIVKPMDRVSVALKHVRKMTDQQLYNFEDRFNALLQDRRSRT